MSDKISAAAFKARGLVWGIFAAGVLVCPGSSEKYKIILGALLLLAGQGLRFWAAGYIPNYRTEKIGAPELITSGPYAFIRNPLYAGNAIMGIGWSLMVSWWWTVIFCAAFIILYPCIIIPAEEKFLESKFGREYAEYVKNVPALLPFGRKEKCSANVKHFDRATAWNMERHSIYMNILITLVIAARIYFR